MTKEEFKDLQLDLQQSGMSITKYLQHVGINYNTYHYWRKKLKESESPKPELARPIMEAMKLWMETEGVKYSENSLIGKAITYTYTRWDNMMRYLEDGRLLLDNNLAENEIRPITLGRKRSTLVALLAKNYLFCGNHEAAQNMAIVCSLLATCMNHDVNPRDYLNDVISQMPYHTQSIT